MYNKVNDHSFTHTREAETEEAILGRRLQQIKGIQLLTIPTPFPVGPVNVYLVEGDVLTLVDTGPKWDEAWSVFKHQLKEAGYAPADIEHVVLTHHHVDHVGLLDFLAQESEVSVFGHWRNEPWISQDPQFLRDSGTFMAELMLQCGVDRKFSPYMEKTAEVLQLFNCRRSLDRVLKEGDAVPGMAGWRVLETPGHALSHISLYRERDGLMLGGDHVLGHISSNALIEPPHPGDKERAKPLVKYRQSLEKLIPYPISRVLPGHGDEVTDVRTLVGDRLREQDERAALIRKWLRDTPMTCFDLCKKMFPSVFKEEFVLALSETLGHLDLLEVRGEVLVEERDGTHYYKACEK